MNLEVPFDNAELSPMRLCLTGCIVLPVTRTPLRRCLSLFGDCSRIFLLGWKKWAMAEPTAPMPPGRVVLGMVEFLHR